METPDRLGRDSILKVHVSKKELPLGEDVDLSEIASMTTGFTGYEPFFHLVLSCLAPSLLPMKLTCGFWTLRRADLANLVNEAALLAGRLNKVVVEKVDFIQAVERSIAVSLSFPSYFISTFFDFCSSNAFLVLFAGIQYFLHPSFITISPCFIVPYLNLAS